MIIKPERIAFAEENDLIDYVARGLPPTKENFEKVICKIKNPDSPDDPEFYNKCGVKVVVLDDVVPMCDREVLDQTLRRIYEDRIHNRNVAIGIGAVIGVGIIAGLLFGGGSKKDDDDIIDIDDDF